MERRARQRDKKGQGWEKDKIERQKGLKREALEEEGQGRESRRREER